MSFLIRRANPADSPEIAEIHYASRRHAYAPFLPDELLNDRSLDYLKTYWAQECADPVSERGQIFVVSIQGLLVGFVVLNEVSVPAEIDRIYVAPAHIGKGAGTAMIEHCLEILTSDSLCVWVFEDNLPARRFYESQGFRLDGNVQQSLPYPRTVRYSMPLP